ncbi:DMT family transporter [Microbulbifer marinus]|uniref:Small multidrug resistance pump n=1 Tax=Microbulbifer marinus TaxID=658218 RepID=A0A1H3WMQ4_9GAMM|nr:multidrug efflux SMR transporter [Microbulbifer marinus]SDZ87478.1 small multidrug resistance pump [Microbulbifer marinus]
MAYLYLAIAIVAEVVGTTALKASEQFTRPLPTLIVAVGYGIAFYMLTLVLRTLPVGIAYAIWSGLGVVLVTLVGMAVYREVPDLPAIIGIGLIIIGVIVINLFSQSVAH